MRKGCSNCDTATATSSAELCDRCRNELRFVVRPAAHRETYRRRVAAQSGLRAEMERLGVVMISSLPDDNGLWICDLCNTAIPVSGDITLIPLIGNYALCLFCVTSLPYWPDGWTEPTPRACRCGACQRPLLNVLSRL